MFAPEGQQMEICVLKHNLEEIENDCAAQISKFPELEKEYERKSNDAKELLELLRSTKSELQKLKQENIRLTAKRVQQKRQCDALSRALEVAANNRDELANSIEQMGKDLQLQQYEDSLRAKADRFRRTYDEPAIKRELADVNTEIAKLETELGTKRETVGELKMHLEGICPQVPDDLLNICGKADLDDKIRALTAEFEALSAKQKMINL